MAGPARRILVIVNPQAGRVPASRRRLDRLVAALERKGCAVTVRVAARVGDAECLARDGAGEFDVVAAAGGDGTAGAVANGLAGCHDGAALAVVPLGTANVLAREIGLPRRVEALAEIIADGPALPIWPGRIGTRLFLMMAGAGFDAEIVATVDPRLKRRFGRLAFAWAIALALRRGRRPDLVVDIDGERHRAAAAILARGRHYAGHFVLAPAARLGEPRLQVVLFHNGSRAAVLRYLGALALGIVHRLPDVTIVAGARVTITTPGQLCPLQVDGDVATAPLPVTIEVATAPLHLVCRADRPPL